MSLINSALKNNPVPQPKTPAVSTSPPKQLIEKKAIELEVDKIRLAVCVPCKDMIHSVFSHNLHSLLNYNWQKGIETRVFYNMGTILSNQREGLVENARSLAATHILWLDSDMSFPFYTAYKLLGHQQKIVAGNYVTRQLPYKTIAYKELGRWDSYLKHGKENPVENEPIEVEGMGMGCMLVDITVYDNLPKPWFPITYQPEADDYLGEDINFCLAAREKGYKILVDDILSRQLNHLGQFAFGHDLVKD